MRQVPNLSPQNARHYSGWPSLASKIGYTQFLKRVVLVYVFLLCPLSACVSSLGDRYGGLFYLVTFVTIIVAVFPLITQYRNKSGGTVSPPPMAPVNTPPEPRKKKKKKKKKDPPCEALARVKNAFEIRPGLVGAGCEVTSGTLTRSARIRVLRRDRVVFEGNIDSLKQKRNVEGNIASLKQRYTVDVSEVASGDGCSVVVRDFSGFEVGDIITTLGNASGGKQPQGGSSSKGGQKQPQGGLGTKPGVNTKPPRAVTIPPRIMVKDLAQLLHLSPNEVIKALTKYEIFADGHQMIDYQRAAMVAKDLGYIPSLRKG